MSNFIPILIFIVLSVIIALLWHLGKKSDERRWNELIETIKKYRAITHEVEK